MSAIAKLEAAASPPTVEHLKAELEALRNQLSQMGKEEARLELRADKLRELVLGSRR